MNEEIFKDRLSVEKKELSKKIYKLETALVDEKIPEAEVDVLFSQLAIMKAYESVLAFRVEKLT